MATVAQINETPCPLCGSEPGERCVLRDGRPASSFHNERAREADRVEADLQRQLAESAAIFSKSGIYPLPVVS